MTGHPGRPLTEECSSQLANADAVVYVAGGPLFDGHPDVEPALRNIIDQEPVT